MLVDASLTHPFFKRNASGRIKGQSAKNTWHNEQRGTLFINNYQKQAGSLANEGKAEAEGLLGDHGDDDDDDDDNDVFESSNAVVANAKLQLALKNHQNKIKTIAASKGKAINHQ